MTAEELRAFEGDTMTSTAPKRCDLPDVALTGAKPGITAFVLGNAERAELTAVAQKCGELDPLKPKLEPARFDQAWRMELKLFGIGSRQFGNPCDRLRFAVAKIDVADHEIPAQAAHPVVPVDRRLARTERSRGFAPLHVDRKRQGRGSLMIAPHFACAIGHRIHAVVFVLLCHVGSGPNGGQ